MTDPPRYASRQGQAREPQARRASRRLVSIGDLARQFEVTTRTIRFYEARGLIQPERNGLIRQYGPQDRRRLALILRGRNLGLSLVDIAEHLALYDSRKTHPHDLEDAKALAERHIAELRRKQGELAAMLADLEEIQARLTKRKPRKS